MPIAARSCRKNDGTPIALSKDAAEKYVGQQVYRSLGIVCERYRTEVIYKDGDTRLIAVQFYTEGPEPRAVPSASTVWRAPSAAARIGWAAATTMRRPCRS